MAEWEDELTPTTKERLAGTDEAGPNEKDLANQGVQVQSSLAQFYAEELDLEGLCKRLESGTVEVIREAQSRLVESLSLSSRPAWFRTTKAAILQLESLKKNQRTKLIEQQLGNIARLQAAYRESLEKALHTATEEENRNREPTIAPGRWISIHGTVAADTELAERLAEAELEAERQYGGEFAAVVQTLRQLVEEED
ncbi:MAG: hypothetical protein QUS33_02660 [Dehalococcoidia bacterium]|nr:hypothetical protein [Dehalococcoidia bacterium]